MREPFNVPLGKPVFNGLWYVSCFIPHVPFSIKATVTPASPFSNKLLGSFKRKANPIRLETGAKVIYLLLMNQKLP